MKTFILILLPVALAGCDVVDPTLIGGPVADGAPAGQLINASVTVLQEQGYTVIAADSEAGIVTTDWRDESSFAGQIFLDESHRSRISVVVDFYSNSLTVQMTKQIKDGDAPWRNDGLSGKDRDRIQTILLQIQSRARAIQEQSGSAVGV
ncbi:MAG: hypothetical protein QGG53_33840 [Planctomycetota bacterium]|nr:hypothetical protein [Planctomycetota bacterium]